MAAGGFTFGSFGAAPAAAPAFTFGSPPAPTAPAPALGAIGAAAPVSAAPFGATAFGAAAAAPPQAATAAAPFFPAAALPASAAPAPPAPAPAAPAAAPAPPPGAGTLLPAPDPLVVDLPSRTLRELLANWRRDVDGATSAFRTQAERVSKWDSQLRRARVDLHHLGVGVSELRESSERVEAELAAMEAHQNRTEQLLSGVEAYIDRLMPPGEDAGGGGGNSYVQGAQRARAEAYDTALDLERLLERLEESLTDAEARIAEEQTRQDNDPLAQVRALLNEEVRNLTQIQAGSAEVRAMARSLADEAEAPRR